MSSIKFSDEENSVESVAGSKNVEDVSMLEAKQHEQALQEAESEFLRPIDCVKAAQSEGTLLGFGDCSSDALLCVPVSEHGLHLSHGALPELSLAQIGFTKQRFAFEGKILVKYGTYDSDKDFKKNLRVDLADRIGQGTITLVFGPGHYKENVDKVFVGKCIRVEGAIVVGKASTDGGSVDYSLNGDGTTTVQPIESFEVSVCFVPEITIKSFFVKQASIPSLKSTIACKTLFVLDYTLIVPLFAGRRKEQLLQAFHSQIHKLGYGKEIVGILNITNFNGTLIDSKCSLCKSQSLDVLPKGSFCTVCAKVVDVEEHMKLAGEIKSNNFCIDVTISGSACNNVLGLEAPLLQLYKKSAIMTRVRLSEIAVEGCFIVDTHGQILGYRSQIATPSSSKA